MFDLNENLIDDFFEGIYYTDSKGRIKFWNKAAEDITGYKRDEVLDSKCEDNILIHIDKAGERLCFKECPIKQAVKEGSCMTNAYLQHKNGYRIPVTIKTFPVRDESYNVTGVLEIFKENMNIDNMEYTLNILREQAMLDPLTNLANRRYLEINLNAKLNESKRYSAKTGILFIDIDDFKSVNDTHGHEAGDAMLKNLSMTLSKNTRPSDIVGRWGGEEFLLIIPNIDARLLTQIANKLRNLIRNSSIMSENNAISITVSIGATMISPDDTSDTLIKRADSLMYRSKKAGKNKVTAG